MTDKVQKVQKIREAIDKIQDSTMDKNGNFNSDYDQGRYDALCDADTLLQNLLDEFILEQKLSNVERTGKDWKEKPVKRTPADIEAAMQEVEEKSRAFTEAHKGEDTDTILAQMRGEEPVSEDLEKIVEEIAEPTILNAYGTKELARRLRNTICGISISEDLDEYINELSKQFPEVSFAKLSRIAVRVAKWKNEQMMAKAVNVEVKVDDGGYPYIPQMELYDYDKDVPLAKEGDKYKVVLIKEN